jgi:hypothetical protein
MPKFLPAGATLDRRAAGFQLLNDPRCLVAEVIDAPRLAPTPISVVGEFDHDQLRCLEDIARDPERSRETMGLNPIGEPLAHQ